jgi:hypothetical protein
MTIDIDSTICDTYGYAKQAATCGRTRRRDYHPLLAARAETGEVLAVRFRMGRGRRPAPAISRQERWRARTPHGRPARDVS